MKAYIAVSYSKKKSLSHVLHSISTVLHTNGITPFIFADVYRFEPWQEKEMMQHAMAAIDSADLLIAETSDKAIGIGIEAGYAAAKNKPVIYIRNKEAEHSTTLSGISSAAIIYAGLDDLEKQLDAVIKTLFKNT